MGETPVGSVTTMPGETPISANDLDRAILHWMHELSPHGICATDTDLKIRSWNSWLEAASGLSKAEVIGKSLLESFPEIKARRLDAYFHKALKGEISMLSAGFHQYLFRFPSPIKSPGFSLMLQAFRIAPLMENGVVVGTITTIEDVTQREYQNSLLRKQSERQELFSWALAHLLQSRDPDTLVKRLFPRVSAFMNVDTYWTYLMEDDGRLHLHSSAGISPGLKQQITERFPGEAFAEASASGDTFQLSNIQETSSIDAASHRQLGLHAYVCHPLTVDDKVIGTLSFGSRSRAMFDKEEVEFTRVIAQYVAIAIERLRNVDALRKAQEELSRHAESLEAKVQERTAKLRESIADLESFSYSLAHDLRAPLRHIQGYAQLLKEDFGENISPEATAYVDAIARSIKRLDALTQDILTYNQVSRHKVEMLPIDLEAVVQDVIARNPAFSEPGVVIVKSPLHPVLGERVLLDQSLGNLLDNALKFVPKSVRPQIIVRTELRSPEPEGTRPRAFCHRERVRIWVEDNGIGIAPEFHGKIFGIFERLASDSQGTGIGLAIVSKAVDRMGGSLGVVSESHKGSRFWIELPAA